MDNTDMVLAALGYARRGWRVHPLRGKSPTVTDWPNAATTDEAQIRRWWRAQPDANVGLVTGAASGIWVLDVDGDEGEALLSGLDLPPTPRARTGGDGNRYHLYFSTTDATLGNRARRGVDVRAEGGNIAAPPSIHPDTDRRYAWVVHPDTVPLAPIPRRLLDRLYPTTTTTPPTRPVTVRGTVDDDLRRRYGQSALARGAAVIAGAREGERNHRLNSEVFSLAGLVPGGYIAEGELRDDAIAAAMAAGLPQHEATATVASAIRGGIARPRDVDLRAPTKPQPRASVVVATPMPHAAPVVAPLRLADPDSDWSARLNRRRDGGVEPDAWNIELLLDHEGGGVIALDLMAQEVVVTDRAPWDDLRERYPRQWTDVDAQAATVWLAREWRVKTASKNVYDAALRLARRNSYDPLRWYLADVRWDGVERVKTLASTVLGASTVPSDELLARWLTSAVARALVPGCKSDSIIVLGGAQNLGKSKLFDILGGEWFRDDIIDLGGKDMLLLMAGAWIYEIAELDALSRREETTNKAFLSKRSDSYRRPYDRTVCRVDRRCVFGGTTNEDTYLRDPTGARRYWPVDCTHIDTDYLIANRDQIWAETVQLFHAGYSWWDLSPDAKVALAEVHADRTEMDPWAGVILPWLSTTTSDRVTVLMAARQVGMSVDQLTPRAQRRIAGVLRQAGWVRVRTRSEDGGRTYAYERG